jgi:hypothetical protein
VVILECKYNYVNNREKRESLTIGVLVMILACKCNYANNREKGESLTIGVLVLILVCKYNYINDKLERRRVANYGHFGVDFRV